MSKEQGRAEAFVQWLQEHREDRGMMAELRRGLNRDTEWFAWKYLSLWCDITSPSQRRAYGVVAGAYAAHPEASSDGNLGDTVRRVATRADVDQPRALASFEGRFRRLLACGSVAEVADQVRHVVRAAKQRQIPVNYTQLLTDLLDFRWPTARERIRVYWASAFWAAVPEGGSNSEGGAEAI